MQKENLVYSEKKIIIIKINELERDLRIETVMRRMKKKQVSFKMKNKEIAG